MVSDNSKQLNFILSSCADECDIDLFDRELVKYLFKCILMAKKQRNGKGNLVFFS